MINPETNYICKWYGKILHIFNPIYRINYYYISTPSFAEFCKLMKRGFNVEIKNDGDKEGFFTILTKVKRHIDVGVIWTKNRRDYGTLAHECFHALYWTAHNRGLNNLTAESEEAFAYLLGFLVNTIQEA